MAIISLKADELGKWGLPEHDGVGFLDRNNFDDFIQKHQYVFVKFYASWCDHCKSMEAAYSSLSQRFKEHQISIPVVEINGNVETPISEKYEVRGYPTLKLFVDGEPIDYKGARDEETLFNWILQKMEQSVTEISSVQELTVLESNRISILLVTTTSNTPILKTFNTLAGSYPEIPFHYTYSNEIRKKLDLDEDTHFVILRTFDDGVKILSANELRLEDMKSFFLAYKYEAAVQFDQETADRIFNNHKHAIIMLSDDSENEKINIFKEVAREYIGGPLLFVKSTITSGLGSRLAEFLGVTAKDENSVRLIRFSQEGLAKFKLEDISEQSLHQFIDEWKNDKLQQYFKSENIPEDNSGPVKVVVGKNFENIVFDDTKDVLLEAYAPWCGHCKQFEPIYKELAENLSVFPNIVIAKMDGTANEHKSLLIKGYPTIKLYKVGNKQNPIDFTGEKDINSLMNFLQKELERNLTIDPSVDENL